MIREALDRAKTPSPQRKRLKFASLVCDAKTEDSSGKGCSNLIASASRALQLERVESQKRLPRESCSCAGLSPKLHCARLERFRALGLRKRSRAELLRPARGRRL